MLLKDSIGIDLARYRLLKHKLRYVLRQCYGYYALNIAAGSQLFTLDACPINNRIYIAPADSGNSPDIIADPGQLPIASNSVDLVMLPFTLQLTEAPHHALREAQRVLIEDGRLIIIGRNPLSWQAIKYNIGVLLGLERHKLHELTRRRIRDWLTLLQLNLEQEVCVSISNEAIQLRKRNPLLKRIARFLCFYFCSYYIIVAHKKVARPIGVKPGWKKRKVIGAKGAIEPSVRQWHNRSKT